MTGLRLRPGPVLGCLHTCSLRLGPSRPSGASRLLGRAALGAQTYRLRPCRPGSMHVCASMGLGGGSWHPHRDQGPLLKALYDYLESAAESMLAFIKAAWELQQHWVHQAWARTILGCALALGFVTAVVNAWGVPAINRKLPQVAQQASHALQRDVDIGKVHWVAPTGLTGLHPLVSMGPIAVGAGPVERSSAVLERVSLRVDPLQSLLRGRIVLALKASGAEVHLKQASNFSWFGYPDDTSPSARNFLPGIAGASEEKGQDPPGKGRRGGTGGVGTGGGTASGGTHNGAGSSAGHAQLAAAPRSEHGETTKSKAARVNGFLETIAQELLAWHAAQEEKATNALVAMHASSSKSEEPAVVLLNVGGPARVPRPQETMRIASQSQTAATDMERGEQSGSWFKLNPFASRKSPAPQGQEAEEQATGVERSKQSQLESLNTFEVSAKPRDGKGGAHPADTREPAASSADVASVEAVASAADPIASTVSAAPAAASSPEILEQQPTPAIDERITPVANLDTASSTAAQGDHEGQAAATSVMYTSEEESIDANRRMTLVERNPPANLIPSDRAAEFINALPGLQMSLVRGSAGEQGPSAEALPHPPPSAATRKINAMEATSAGAEIPVTMAVRSSSGVAEFMGTVIDPATIRKQGLGSKALQKARNWQPAKPLVPRSSPESPSSNATHPLSLNDSEVHFSLEDGSEQAPATEDHARLSRSTSMSDSSQEATHARSPNSKLHVTHPGYFPTSTGPVYTPAPPEALARLRARQRTAGTLLRELMGAVAGQVQRSLVVGAIDLSGGTLYGYIHGEELPRIFENVSAKLKLGAGYDSLQLEILADPHERDPASSKCTMLHPSAHRHLRQYTGLAALDALKASQEAAEVPAEPAVTDTAEATIPSPASEQKPRGRPTGGHLRVTVSATGVVENDLDQGGPRVPDLSICVQGKNLHAPLIERIIELPMDIDAGRVDGELIIQCKDVESWDFPQFHGRVVVRGAAFHFWDATDDILDADLDLLFESDRVYLHRAKGRFGAVPMTVTGDLDLDPLTGEYRLSAKVPGVEANMLRATLGVRPMPFPVAGAVMGTLHVTGPLEKPVFSGHAKVTRPTPEMLSDCEPTAALTALQEEPTAVGAYDRIPFSAASLVFSLDTASQDMTLHAVHAEPVGGGVLQGTGTVGVSPQAETDPNALAVTVQAYGLPAEDLARRYLPEGAQLPPGILVGAASANATLKGAHLSPVIDVAFAAPEGGANGTARFTRTSTAVTLRSPYVDAVATVHVDPPSYEAIKAANTQAEATALAAPNVTGCDADVTMKGLDVVPLVSDDASLRQLAQQSGEPLRLKVNGRARVAGAVSSGKASPDASSAGGASPWKFAGTMDLEDLRLNQLKLYRGLKGNLELSENNVSVHARGLRADEVLDVDLSLPLLPGDVSAAALPSSGDAEGSPEAHTEAAAAAPGGSAVSVRCGQLVAAATVDAQGSQVDFRVANVHLDELELASLRGELQEVSCTLNFAAQTGRGRLSLTTPRYSGLGGESLSGGFRWERDVVRLEKLVLQQKHSKYEAQGEYVVPPSMPLPTSAADLARQQLGKDAAGKDATGRWRLRVDVPAADMQEILPAARLLQSAASQAPADYERAKTAFIEAVKTAALKASDLNAQLVAFAEKAAGIAGMPQSSAAPGARANSSSVAAPLVQLPALQDVRGNWSGSIQAFGGGGGATSCEFDVRGNGWQWGQASLDALVANGNYHSEEGVQLQELVLKSGDAKLLVRGSLLSEHQDASILITDFPVATLQPIFRAIPALQNTAPAAPARVPDPVPSPLPLGMLANALGGIGQNLPGASSDSDSPINGLLYVSGTLGGSAEAPTGEVAVRVYDAAVGQTRLAQAQASARLSDTMQLSFNVDVVPVEGHRKSGHVRAAGTVPLAALTAADGAVLSPGQPSVAEAPAAPQGPLDVRLSVRDDGMTVLTSLTPDFKWQSGEADLSLRLTGTIDQPTVNGAVLVSKATVDVPVFKYPLEVVSADVRFAEGMLEVGGVEARLGRKGHVRTRGTLPIYHPDSNARGAAPVLAAMQHRLTVDVQGLELRARNTYAGQVDALLTVRDSVEHPVVGGSLRFSRGSVYLIPQGQDMGPVTAGVTAPAGPSVAKTFRLLTRGEAGMSAKFEDAVRHEVEAMEHMMEDTAGANVTLDGLAVQFGPDLRAVYPLVMNFAVDGELVCSGPAHPDAVAVEGKLVLPSGDVNLLAAQFELDREHDNVLMFGGPGAPVGVDPMVDVVLTSGELRVSVLGRASEWTDHLVMQSVGGGTGGDAGEQLDAAEAARLLETKLKAALLADDGQLALSRLAGSTVSTLMPKIETQGTVGGARWRLVSAPAIPGLLDPLVADPSNLLGSITMGTEVEVQFGRKLQAAMVRKLRDSDVNTQWTLNYNLSSKLRMQFNISSAPPYPKTLTFQYSSEGSS